MAAPSSEIDRSIDRGRSLRRVLSAYPTGVAALAAVVDGAPIGLIANSFTSVSLDPPLVSACIAHTSRSWPFLRQCTRIGITVLGQHQEWVSRQMSTPCPDRFAQLQHRISDDGCVLISGAAAWFDCSVHLQVAAGDHDIVVFEIKDHGADHDVLPLVFHASAYRRLA